MKSQRALTRIKTNTDLSNPIQIEGLHKSLGGRAVLKSLDLSIPEGMSYGLLGRNGAGKTTLLKILIGLYRADAGRALVLGDNLNLGCPENKKYVGFVAEGDLLPAGASVQQVVDLEAGLRHQPDLGGLERWMAGAGVSGRQKIGTLSKGMKKRLELELLLAGRPRVMILDEPFDGLDPVSRNEFSQRLKDYQQGSNAVTLVSSHILSDLEKLCDRIGVMAGGRITLEEDLDRMGKGGFEAVSVRLLNCLQEDL